MKKIIALLALCLFVGACASSTPQGRIESSPEKYAALSAKHKALVQQGKIDRGMSKDGVLLAWGTPASHFEGSEQGRFIERWDYAGSKPVMTSSYSGGFYDYWGYGYGRRYSPYGYSFAVGPEVVYVPYTKATVSFVKGRVDSWEREK